MEFSWNLFVLLFFAVFSIYGLLLGRNRILGILVSSYLGLAIAQVAGEPVYNFFSNFRIISNNLTASLFGTKVLILVVVTFLLTIKSEISGQESSGMLSSFRTALYGFLTAGLLLSSSISFMGDSAQISLFSASNLANIVYSYHLVWVVAPILIIIGAGFFRK